MPKLSSDEMICTFKLASRLYLDKISVLNIEDDSVWNMDTIFSQELQEKIYHACRTVGWHLLNKWISFGSIRYVDKDTRHTWVNTYKEILDTLHDYIRKNYA